MKIRITESQYKILVNKPRDVVFGYINEIRRTKTKEEFINDAEKIHQNPDGTPKYDYENVNYIKALDKVEIICPEHGSFFQIPNNHLRGMGCPKCSGNNRKNSEEFIKDAEKIHLNSDGTSKYSYENVKYTNNSNKVEITCPKHGSFYQRPSDHLNGKGCPICYNETRSEKRSKTTEEFIKDALIIHPNPDGTPKYNYDKVNYVKALDKVEIICPKHGSFFQTPNGHLRGRGCPICSESKGEKIIYNYLVQKYGDEVISQKEFDNCNNEHKGNVKCHKYRFDFYLPQLNIIIEYDGEQHFKKTFFHKTDEHYIEKVEDDKHKTSYCMTNSIKLIRISYNEKDIIGQLTKGLEKINELWLSDNYPKAGWNR
jgi:very-short-patch-repair endonuclease/Zn finger protein HypA/HybF involved in hydrogenase expression